LLNSWDGTGIAKFTMRGLWVWMHDDRGCPVKTIFFLGLAGFLLSLLGGLFNQYDFEDDNDDWFDLFPLN